MTFSSTIRTLVVAALLLAGVAPLVAQEVDRAKLDEAYKTIKDNSDGKAAEAARRLIRRHEEARFKKMGVTLTGYALPVKYGWWVVSQGNSTDDTHTGVNQFSWDFVLVDRHGQVHPEGLKAAEKPKENYAYGVPFYAAADGRVVWIKDDGVEDPEKDESCTIVVKHDDGTRGVYDHVRPSGIQVRKGQRVRRGDRLGLVGYPGTNYPHLHFSVKLDEHGTVPIRFERYVQLKRVGFEVARRVTEDGVPEQMQVLAATMREATDPRLPEKTEDEP